MGSALKTLRENSPVSCLEDQESGSSQVKAKRKHESGCKGTVKKASFRSRTVKYEMVGETLDRRL